MKMKLPKDSKHVAVSVEGKSYKPDPQSGTVDLPNDLPKATVRHLISLGWKVADEAADKKAREAGLDVRPDSKPGDFGGDVPWPGGKPKKA